MLIKINFALIKNTEIKNSFFIPKTQIFEILKESEL